MIFFNNFYYLNNKNKCNNIIILNFMCYCYYYILNCRDKVIILPMQKLLFSNLDFNSVIFSCFYL